MSRQLALAKKANAAQDSRRKSRVKSDQHSMSFSLSNPSTSGRERLYMERVREVQQLQSLGENTLIVL